MGISPEIMTEWRKTVLRMDRMVSNNTPGTIRAHFMVRVLIPRLARICGVDEFTEQLGTFIAEHLSGHIGLCRCCHKIESVKGDSYCQSCLDELKEYNDMMDENTKADEFLD